MKTLGELIDSGEVKLGETKVAKESWYGSWCIPFFKDIDGYYVCQNQLGSTSTIHADDASTVYKVPKKKKRYWQWKVKCNGGQWLKPDYYLDEEGRDTSNAVYDSRWNRFERVKVEDDYVDVEVE